MTDGPQYPEYPHESGEQPQQPPPQYGQPQYGQPPYGQAPYGQAPYGQAAYGPVPPGWAPPTPTNGKAVWSMITGILAIVLCYVGFVIGIVAIVLAVSAKNDFKERPGTSSGDGMATAGLVCGIIGTVLWGGTVLLFVALGVSGV